MRVRGYNLSGILYLVFCFCYTKCFYKQSRLIRLPFRTRQFSKIKGMVGFTTGVDCRIDVFTNAKLEIGDDVQINDNVHIACAEYIKIGKNTLIASKVYLTDHDHDFTSDKLKPIDWPLKSEPLIIGDNCWIGENVCILKGVSIGDGCIVGANAVVTKSFPNGVIIAGNPAKIIRFR
ncbi:DapH/DapD/GlmU-related protein [Shewanella baltica]|uniref:DapH/DapD/GlmU-related protein n=1 Tax=Shewanella baltica TaxID=62322 RepID=UPI00217E6169|nr:DapH/DapD/GlmU-related protein [Shewanella baltica]MCS6124076.1 lipopolysaccharide biosynthesis protein [Shewanella baltica]